MKKVFLTAFLIVCMFTLMQIAASYSLFETDNDIVVKEDVGKWVIKVNNNSVGDVVAFDVDNFVVSSSPDVTSGKFAPGENGYFEIEIDPEGTDTSVRYDLFIDEENIINNQFVIDSVTEINGNSLILSSRDTYTGIINLSDVQNNLTHTVRVNITWTNDENNNYTDSIWGLSGEDVSIPVNVHLIQYLGETVSVYTGA